MSPNPTLVFVHGAWHRASTWNKVTSILEPKEYKCVSVSLPSCSGNPSATLKNDVDVVRNTIIAETTEGRDVVVVTHSYGGLVGASAVKDLTRQRGDTTQGHVMGLAMISTGFCVTGLSFMGVSGGKPPPFWVVDEETGFAVLTADTRELFYHDLPEDEGNAWVSKLQSQSLKSLFEGGEHVYSGWKDVPSWFLATVEDKALPVQAQHYFVQVAKDAGGVVTMREVASSHSPMLSKPEETVDFILGAVKDFLA